MASAACSAAGPPKKASYKPKGKFLNLGDLPLYQIGAGKKVIIMLYDIFGWNEVNKNVFAFADDLAGFGAFTVVMPDVFRGEPWPLAEFPPQSPLQKKAFNAWLSGVAADVVFRKDVYEKVLPHLWKSNYKDIGCIGFCIGGKQSFLMGADKERFKSIASLHGAHIDDNLCHALEVPVYYGPAKDDYEVAKVQKALEKKKFKKKCQYHAFTKMQHGFCAARGDWTDLHVKKEADIALKEAVAFFKKTL